MLNRKRIGIDRVRESLSLEGYSLHSVKYKNQHTPLEYTCPFGHLGATTWNSWRSGSRCPKCVKTPYTDVVQYFTGYGYTVTSTKDEYDTSGYKYKIEFICPEGHTSSMSYPNFKAGHRCGECAPNRKKTIEEVSASLKKLGCDILSTKYLGNREDLVYICPNGHEHTTTWSNFNKGQGCPKCTANISKAEESIYRYFCSLGLKPIQSDREIIKPVDRAGAQKSTRL